MSSSAHLEWRATFGRLEGEVDELQEKGIGAMSEHHRVTMRAIRGTPMALAIIGAAVTFAGGFLPWFVVTEPGSTYTFGNGGVINAGLALPPVIWAMLVAIRTPSVFQGCVALLSAFLLALVIWYLTLYGATWAAYCKGACAGRTVQFGLGLDLAIIGCPILAIAGLARIVQALLARRSRGHTP